VLGAVEMGEGSCDGVAAAVGLSGPDTAAALARLELLGYVSCSAVGAYSRTLLPPPPSAGI
jgi:predicted Rossmann fold nucleotide-binding protein DprA/Smf involved in DNA uptake